MGVLSASVSAASASREAQVRATAAHASCVAPTVVMKSWLAAWKSKNFRRMVELSEQSWRLRASGAVGQLRDQYGFKDVLSYRFVRCSGSSVSARVTIGVTYKTFKRVHVRITGMVIREDRQGDPSPVGRWGVNPISTLRENPA
jgi:hypothetical protein